jgi:hypothetical protein
MSAQRGLSLPSFHKNMTGEFASDCHRRIANPDSQRPIERLFFQDFDFDLQAHPNLS